MSTAGVCGGRRRLRERSAVPEPRAREKREGARAAPSPQEPAGVQGRERRRRRAGSRGRCTARAVRGDGAARPDLEGRARGMERSSGPPPPGSEPRAAEGAPGSRARCGRRARSRGAGAGLMLPVPGSRGGGSALGV